MVDGDQIRKERARGPRPTQERIDALRRRWVRSAEIQHDARLLARFIKPNQRTKAKGLTKRQWRKIGRPESGQLSKLDGGWPTNKEIKRQSTLTKSITWEDAAAEVGLSSSARATSADAGDDEWKYVEHHDVEDSHDEVDDDAEDTSYDQELAEQSEEEDEEENERDGSLHDELLPKYTASDADDSEEKDLSGEDEEEAGNVNDESLEKCGTSDDRQIVIDAQYGSCLSSEAMTDLRSRAGLYKSAVGATGAFASWTWRGSQALDVVALDGVMERMCATVREAMSSETLSAEQRGLLRALATYRDVLATNAAADFRRARKTRHLELLRATMAHCVDHVLRSRARVLRRNKKLKRRQLEAAVLSRKKPETGGLLDEETENEAWRDQGLSRPRLLVLVPTRSAAYEAGSEIERLVGDRVSVANRRRFEEELGPQSVQDDGRQGPADWNELFGPGANADDDVEVGVSVTPGRGKKAKIGSSSGVALRLFSQPKESDILLASPVSIRQKIETLENDATALDAYASLEIVVVYRAEMLLMQNWDHVEAALAACNRRPGTLDPKVDLSRVRRPILEDQGRACRQTVILSTIADARLRALLDAPGRSAAARQFFKHDCLERNRAGAARLAAPPIPDDSSALECALEAGPATHVFQCVRVVEPVDAPAANVAYFAEKLLPSLVKAKNPGTLLVCSSYHEYLACRAALRANNANFVAVHDYSRGSEVSRARSRFYHNHTPIMLYSSRAHFYHRYRIRGPSTIVFLSPPDFPHFYPELCRLMFDKHPNGADTLSRAERHVLLLYTRFDALALNRIVGTRRARAMLTRDDRDSIVNATKAPDAHIFHSIATSSFACGS